MTTHTTPSAIPENLPVTITMCVHEAFDTFNALQFWSKRTPRHFDCGRPDVRDLLKALRAGMEDYPDRCDVMLESCEVPPITDVDRLEAMLVVGSEMEKRQKREALSRLVEVRVRQALSRCASEWTPREPPHTKPRPVKQ